MAKTFRNRKTAPKGAKVTDALTRRGGALNAEGEVVYDLPLFRRSPCQRESATRRRAFNARARAEAARDLRALRAGKKEDTDFSYPRKTSGWETW